MTIGYLVDEIANSYTITNNTPVNGDITIIFLPDNGTLTYNTITIEECDSGDLNFPAELIIPTQAAARTGYIFTGWTAVSGCSFNYNSVTTIRFTDINQQTIIVKANWIKIN